MSLETPTLTKVLIDTNENQHIFKSSLTDDDLIVRAVENPLINYIAWDKSPFLKDEVVLAQSLKKMHNSEFYPFFKAVDLVKARVYGKPDLEQFKEDIDKINDFPDYFNTPKRYLKLMADELLSNALKQTDDGLIKVNLGQSEDFIILRVIDEVGELGRSRLAKVLKRSFEEKTVQDAVDNPSGAGLGLYIVHSFSNRLIFNVLPSKFSEIICIIEKNKRMKSFKSRKSSLGLFFGEV